MRGYLKHHWRHCERQRNTSRGPRSLDCFVAGAPRNDGGALLQEEIEEEGFSPARRSDRVAIPVKAVLHGFFVLSLARNLVRAGSRRWRGRRGGRSGRRLIGTKYRPRGKLGW